MTSPHGRELGEHGSNGFAQTLFEEVLRVPLLVHAPKLVRPARSDSVVSLADVAPTLRLMLDLPAAGYADGRPLLEGGQLAVDERPAVAELVLPERVILRAVVSGDAKLISSFDHAKAMEAEPGDPNALWMEPVEHELFDLGTDPGESQSAQTHQRVAGLEGVDASSQIVEGQTQPFRRRFGAAAG